MALIPLTVNRTGHSAEFGCMLAARLIGFNPRHALVIFCFVSVHFYYY